MNERDKKKKKIVLEGRKYMSLHANGIIKKNKTPREAHDPKDHGLSFAKSFHQQ